MKCKKVKYDSIKLTIIRKDYEINQAIKNLIKDLPHCEFEDLRFKLLDEIIDLRRLKENRLP
jgi:hypothetical protein